MRLAENPQDPALDLALDPRPNLVLSESADLGDVRDLDQRSRLGDVGIDTAEVGGDQVDRHAVWRYARVGLADGRDVTCDAGLERLVGGRVVAAGGVGRVVR